MEAEWDKMTAELCQNLIESNPRWIVGVLHKSQMQHAKY